MLGIVLKNATKQQIESNYFSSIFTYKKNSTSGICILTSIFQSYTKSPLSSLKNTSVQYFIIYFFKIQMSTTTEKGIFFKICFLFLNCKHYLLTHLHSNLSLVTLCGQITHICLDWNVNSSNILYSITVICHPSIHLSTVNTDESHSQSTDEAHFSSDKLKLNR